MKSRSIRLVLALASSASFGPRALADEKPVDGSYVLFMGADLDVQKEKKVYRVEDVAGSRLKIHVGGEEVYVPTLDRQIGLKIDHNLKLSGEAVVVDNLKMGPAYTYENDPIRRLQEAAGNAESAATAQDMAFGKIVAADNASSLISAAAQTGQPSGQPAGTGAKPEVLAQMAREDAANRREYNNAYALSNNDLSHLGGGANRMALQEGKYDAMDVSFKISSPVDLAYPYMVVLFEFHDPAAKPGVDGMVVHVEGLGHVDSHPRYFRVLQGGLPVGFQFINCSIHIYNRGKEVATNVAPNRMSLKRDEAQQYVVMERVGHKGANLSANAVKGTLPLVQRQRLNAEQLNRLFYVRVDKEGTKLGAFLDEGCTIKLADEAAERALDDVLFQPALAQGKPVEGIARLRLGDI